MIMNKLKSMWVVLGILTISISSCEKDEVENKPSINGKWELTESRSEYFINSTNVIDDIEVDAFLPNEVVMEVLGDEVVFYDEGIESDRCGFKYQNNKMMFIYDEDPTYEYNDTFFVSELTSMSLKARITELETIDDYRIETTLSFKRK